MPPIAMPTLARASAGASLTPSPIIATAWWRGLQLGDDPHLVLGQQVAMVLVHAGPAARSSPTVWSLSPESTASGAPQTAQCAHTIAAEVGRTGRSRRRPQAPPQRTIIAVFASSANGRGARAPPAAAQAEAGEQLRGAHLDRAPPWVATSPLPRWFTICSAGANAGVAPRPRARPPARAVAQRFSAVAAGPAARRRRARDGTRRRSPRSGRGSACRSCRTRRADAPQRLDEPPALEQDAVAGGVRDRGQDRRGRGDDERARRRHHQAASLRGRTTPSTPGAAAAAAGTA